MGTGSSCNTRIVRYNNALIGSNIIINKKCMIVFISTKLHAYFAYIRNPMMIFGNFEHLLLLVFHYNHTLQSIRIITEINKQRMILEI